MGQTGEFNEYQFTGSYSSVYSTTYPPPVNGVYIGDTTSRDGSWQTIYVVSNAQFTALSGSLVIPPGVTIAATEVLRGSFTTIKLASGTVIAYQGSVSL